MRTRLCLPVHVHASADSYRCAASHIMSLHASAAAVAFIFRLSMFCVDLRAGALAPIC